MTLFIIVNFKLFYEILPKTNGFLSLGNTHIISYSREYVEVNVSRTVAHIVADEAKFWLSYQVFG